MSEQRATDGRFLSASAATPIAGPTGPWAARTHGVAVVGVPYDGGVSYRAGARHGPAAIRAASDSIESYCPRLDRDLTDHPLVDLGDLVIDNDAGGEPLVVSLRTQRQPLPDRGLLALGGDHLVALPFIERALVRWPDLQIIHIDAHTDLRSDWEGERFSHATVIRRVLDVMPDTAHIHSLGVRSGLREEFALAHADPRISLLPLSQTPAVLAARLAAGSAPIYITLDVDGLDPSALPGTGTPEPGGLSFREVEDALVIVAQGPAPVVGADLVEVAPPLDPSGVTNVVAARLARTLLLALGAQ